MKKRTIQIHPILFIIVLASFFMIISCSSQMERDAKVMAKRVVEFEQVHKRYSDRSNFMGKPMSREELERYNNEYIEFATSMLAKYNETPEMHQEFYKMVEEKAEQLRKKSL